MTSFIAPKTIASPRDRLKKASSIYEYTHTSASSLLGAFDDAKAKRGNPRGVLTDQEQDILRAALVMCCAGLDGALKQAIRDSLQYLLAEDDQVRQGFEKFIHKRISGEDDILELSGGTKFLATVLADSEPRERLIEEYIRQLTGDSLQSAEEVMRTLSALGIDPKEVKLDIARLKEIFQLRNTIIHELDIDLEAPKRKRRVRSQTDLLDNADHILGVTRSILQELNKRV